MSQHGEGHREPHRPHPTHPDYVKPPRQYGSSDSSSESSGESLPHKKLRVPLPAIESLGVPPSSEIPGGSLPSRSLGGSQTSSLPGGPYHSAYKQSVISMDNAKAYSPPTKGQSLNTRAAAASRSQRVVRWSSSVRPGPYDPLKLPSHGPFTEEEDWIIAWGRADGLNEAELGRALPNRSPQAPMQRWHNALAKKPEFAWVEPRRITVLAQKQGGKQAQKLEEGKRMKMEKEKIRKAEQARKKTERERAKAERDEKRRDKAESGLKSPAHKHPELLARRGAAQDPRLLQLYREGHSQDEINAVSPGGYQRCIEELVPKHPEVEAERRTAQLIRMLSGSQDALLLNFYCEGMLEMEIDEQIPGGWQRCIETILPMHPEAKIKRARNQRNIGNRP